MAVSEERNRLARNLHDSAKQQALAASFELGTALTMYERDPQEAKEHLLAADALVDIVRKELANLVAELRPHPVNEQNFCDSLKAYAEDWSQRSEMALEMDIEEGNLSLDQCEALFRIAQEALANTARHSSASRVVMRLQYERNRVIFELKDNGCGFDPQASHAGIGMSSMRERAEACGGSITIASAPGEGTQICVILPLE